MLLIILNFQKQNSIVWRVCLRENCGNHNMDRKRQCVQDRDNMKALVDISHPARFTYLKI